jgi:hypothetical protein
MRSVTSHLILRDAAKRLLLSTIFFPSPLVGEGGEIERSEIEPGEGE